MINTLSLRELGRQFHAWHKDNRIQFEYGGRGRGLELEIERIMGLIDYVAQKKETLLKNSQK